jgi:hypothetical protein
MGQFILLSQHNFFFLNLIGYMHVNGDKPHKTSSQNGPINPSFHRVRCRRSLTPRKYSNHVPAATHAPSLWHNTWKT